jgi:hypothetical protein
MAARDALKVSIFQGSTADLEVALNACCQSLGIAKTMGTLIGVWTAHYISLEDNALMWGYNAWNLYAEFGGKSKRIHNVQRLLQMTLALSALPIQSSVPSYNVSQLFNGSLLCDSKNNDNVTIKINKYAVRQARPYLFKWINALRSLKTGLNIDIQDEIWRLLNTMLSTTELCTLKCTLPLLSLRSNTCHETYFNHILALLWDLLVTEHKCLRCVSELFICELVSPNVQLTERMSLLYITCLYLPLVVVLFEPLLHDNKTIEKNQDNKKECMYMWDMFVINDTKPIEDSM